MTETADELLQRTTEWENQRAGRITASAVHKVLAKSKRDGKPLKARDTYLGEIVVEILTGEAQGIPDVQTLMWGRDVEPAAVAAYEARYGVIVQAAGFVVAEDCEFFGASPDGLVGEAGGIEIKCPKNSLNHIRTIREGMPEEHLPQIQGGLWATGRRWWDFISYDPRFPPHLRLYVERIARDQAYIDRMATECRQFWEEVQEAVWDLQQKCPIGREPAENANADGEPFPVSAVGLFGG